MNQETGDCNGKYNHLARKQDQTSNRCDNILLWHSDPLFPPSHSPNLKMLSHLKRIDGVSVRIFTVQCSNEKTCSVSLKNESSLC